MTDDEIWNTDGLPLWVLEAEVNEIRGGEARVDAAVTEGLRAAGLDSSPIVLAITRRYLALATVGISARLDQLEAAIRDRQQKEES